MANVFDTLDEGAVSAASSNPWDALDKPAGADESDNSTEADGGELTSTPEADTLVSQAEALVDKVDRILTQVADNKKLREFGGVVDRQNAAMGYVAALIAHRGVDGAAQFLGIPEVDLQAISPFFKWIGEAHNLISETPTIVPIAAIVWGIKKAGKAAFVHALNVEGAGVATQATRAAKIGAQKASWYHVGGALHKHFGISQANAWKIVRGGPWVAAAIAAYIYRSELYGAGRALYDSMKDQAMLEDREQLDREIHTAGDADNPKPLWINNETGEVRVGDDPGAPFVRLNEGGMVSDMMNSGMLAKRPSTKVKVTRSGLLGNFNQGGMAIPSETSAVPPATNMPTFGEFANQYILGSKTQINPTTTWKDAATAVAEMTPILGDAIAAKQVYDELQKTPVNWGMVALLGGGALVGLVPGIGDAAAAAMKVAGKSIIAGAKRIGKVDMDIRAQAQAFTKAKQTGIPQPVPCNLNRGSLAGMCMVDLDGNIVSIDATTAKSDAVSLPKDDEYVSGRFDAEPLALKTDGTVDTSEVRSVLKDYQQTPTATSDDIKVLMQAKNRDAIRNASMTAADRKVFDSWPDPIPVFRTGTQEGWSWSVNPDTAHGFSVYADDAVTVKGYVPKKDVVALISSFGEEELLLDPATVNRITKVNRNMGGRIRKGLLD